jgi:hypothetical protein
LKDDHKRPSHHFHFHETVVGSIILLLSPSLLKEASENKRREFLLLPSLSERRREQLAGILNDLFFHFSHAHGHIMALPQIEAIILKRSHYSRSVFLVIPKDPSRGSY